MTSHVATCLAITLSLTSSPVAAQAREPAPGARLQELVGTWRAVLNTFVSPSDTTTTTMAVSPAARGRGVYSLWRQGSGREAYEANSLWAYDSTAAVVRVFEVNSVGLAAAHFGQFDSTGALVIDRRDATNRLVQRSWMVWARDTLWFRAVFHSATGERRDSVILTRQ